MKASTTTLRFSGRDIIRVELDDGSIPSSCDNLGGVFYNPYREEYFVDVLGYRVDRCQFLDMRVVDDGPVLIMYEKRREID